MARRGGRCCVYSLIPSEGRSDSTDKFETLCHVEADISNAPYVTSSVTGIKGYKRNYNVILLVGLTELKAQISWIDSTTVREHFQVLRILLSPNFSIPMCVDTGDRKKVRSIQF